MKVKNLIKFVAAVGVAMFAVGAQAQPQPGYWDSSVVVLSGSNWTNGIIGGSYYTNVVKIDVRNWSKVALEFKAAGMAATTSNLIWTVGQNVSGVTATNALGIGAGSLASIYPLATVTNVLTGTTPTTKVYELTTGAPYLYIMYAQVEGGGASATNYSVRVFGKL